MKFTLISDVHVDMHVWDWRLLQHCDPLIPMVVSGDISNDVFETSAWIRGLRERFETVIWVVGNHDVYNLGYHQTRLFDPEFSAKWPYPKHVSEIYDHYERWCAAHDVHLLNRSSLVVDHVQFVGATGWHNFDGGTHLSFDDQVIAWRKRINDSRHINWGSHTVGDHKPVLQAALADADYIRAAVQENSLPKVVITHHVPHRNFVKVTSDPIWNLLNGAFLNSELETCVDPSVKVWCFGHTHFRFDSVVNHVRYVNNARGYPRENESWCPVEIQI